VLSATRIRTSGLSAEVEETYHLGGPGPCLLICETVRAGHPERMV
jgi:hypothetical protein